MYYYANINNNKICTSLYASKFPSESNESQIQLESRDITVLGKWYSNGVWNEVPSQLDIIPQCTDTEVLMQVMTDAELRDLEIQQNQELLAQQMGEIELMILGGNA